MSTTTERPWTELRVPPGLLVPEIENDLTRREFLIGAGLIVLAPGCESSGESGEGTDSGGSSGETRTIEHKYGTTEISGTPERVVTVGLTDQDSVLALGITPVGTTEWYGEYPGAIFPWAQDELGDAQPPEIVGSGEPNFEKIAVLEPDLILGLYSGLSEQQYETLSRIAPTVAQPKEYVDYGVPWQEQTRVIGRALGRAEWAEELVAEVEGRFAEMREEHPEFEGATGIVATFEPGYYYVYDPPDSRNRFLSSLGFEIPEEIAELFDDSGVEISREQLSLLDQDVLVWLVNSLEEGEELEDDPIYRQLDVAREGRDVFLASETPLYDAFNFSTVLSLPFALDKLVPMLAAAIDGDPETEVSSAS